MKRIETITGIDLGSSAIRVVVGQRTGGNQLQIIGLGEAPSEGISRGSIINLEAAVTSVSEALEKAERMVGSPLSRAVIGVGGTHVKVIDSQGVVAVSKANGEVDEADVARAVDQSQAVATPPNFEILHVIPRYYNLDNQTHIKDPVGMTGTKLEALTQIILGSSSQIKNINKCVYRTNVDVEGLIFSPLANSQVTLSNRQKDLGVALVNLGAATTSVIIFEEGEMIHAAIIPIGSDHITSDMAIGLRSAIEVAEAIKLDQGDVRASKISKRDEIDLAKYSSEEMPRTLVSRKHIAEIIEARLGEIFAMINAELKKIGKAQKLPAGVILTGGGSRLGGLVDFAKDALSLPVFLGESATVYTPIDKVKGPEFSTALGLVYYASQEEPGGVLMPEMPWAKGMFAKTVQRFRDFLP